jgi:peptidoglycan biosynthesis protein MviN/MurJ (putative lipid II flippase)
MVGLGIGIVRQSVMGAATGFGVAAASYYGPGVLTGVFSAVMGSQITHSVVPMLHSLF